jgi:hypothetical protein
MILMVRAEIKPDIDDDVEAAVKVIRPPRRANGTIEP